MKVRYVGPSTTGVVLADGTLLAPGNAVDVPETLARTLLAQDTFEAVTGRSKE